MNKPTNKQKHQALVLAQITAQKFENLDAQARICDTLSKKLVTRKECKQLAKDIAASYKSAQSLETLTVNMHKMMDRYEDLTELYEDTLDTLEDLIPEGAESISAIAQGCLFSITQLSKRLDELEVSLRDPYTDPVGQYEYVRNRASEFISCISIFTAHVRTERERAHKLNHAKDVKQYDLLLEALDVMMTLPSPIISECRTAHDQVKLSHAPWFARMEQASTDRHKILVKYIG